MPRLILVSFILIVVLESTEPAQLVHKLKNNTVSKFKKPRGNRHWEAWRFRSVAENDTEKFLFDSYLKMVPTECVTIIWDSFSESWLRKLAFCSENSTSCPYKFVIRYEGGNVSTPVARALKAGHATQCGGYMILLKDLEATLEILHFGDDLRTINTRAKFLVWYQRRNLTFERDTIWQKITNVVFFNRTTNTRTRRLSMTIFQKKWPPPTSDLVYSLDNLRPINFLQQGKWVSAKGHNVSWFSDLTRDLKGISLRILVIEHPPAVIKWPDDDERQYGGTDIELIKALEKIMNFKREYLSPILTRPDGEVVFQPNDFLSSLLPLIEGRADIAIGSLFILPDYLDYVDWSVPLDIACTSFLVPNPLPRPRYLALILPFNVRLWLVVVAICFVIAPLILYGISKPKMHRGEFPHFRSRRKVIMTSFQIMSQVAMHLWPRYWSVRLFIGWYWLFTLLITLAYKGAMVSFLTIPLFEQSIDNVDQLAKSKFQLGGWGSELESIFSRFVANHSRRQQDLVQRYHVLEDVNEGISRVADGKFALFENLRFLKFMRQTRNLSSQGVPSMRTMKQCIVPVHMGIAYQKNSPLTHTINSHIRRFAESGLMKKWSARLVQRTRDSNRANEAQAQEEPGGGESGGDDEGGGDSPASHRGPRVLSLADLQGSVYMLFFGLFVSGIAFLVEFFCRHAKISKSNVAFIKKLDLAQLKSNHKLQLQQKLLLEYQAQIQSKLRYPPVSKKVNKSKLRSQLPYPYLE